MAENRLPATILFADICDSTRLYDEQGDQSAYRLVADVLATLHGDVDVFKGRVVKGLGDGLFAVFDAADAALMSAVRMVDNEFGGGLSVRVGLHAGTVIATDEDVFGDAVNVSSRVVDLSQPGEVLMTGDVRDQLSAPLKAGISFLDALPVKGKAEQIQVYRLLGEDNDATMVATGAMGEAGGERALEVSCNGETLRMGDDRQRLSIGRHADCDLVIHGGRVSRHHARIEMAHGRFRIFDTSANGTFVRHLDGSETLLRRNDTELGREGWITLGEPYVDGVENALHFKWCE